MRETTRKISTTVKINSIYDICRESGLKQLAVSIGIIAIALGWGKVQGVGELA